MTRLRLCIRVFAHGLATFLHLAQFVGWIVRHGRRASKGATAAPSGKGWLLAGLLLAFPPAWADEYLLEKAYLLDRSGQLTLDQVRTQPFQPYENILNQGFGESPVWIRLKVAGVPASALDPADKLILRITPVHLDEVEIFDDAAPSALPRRTGDLYNWSQDEHRSLTLNFKIPRAETSRHVWLRVKTTNIRTVHVEVRSQPDLRKFELQFDMISGAYMGCIVLFFGWALNLYVTSRERLLLFYLIKQAAALTYSLFALGYMRVLLDGQVKPMLLNNATNYIFSFYIFAGIIYHWTFLQELRPPAWILNLFLGFSLVFPVVMFLLLSGYTVEALRLNLLTLLLAGMIAVMAMLLLKKSEGPDSENWVYVSKRSLVLAHVVMFAFLLLSLASAKGIGFTAEWTLYTPMLQGLLSGFLLTILLQVRAYRMTKREALEQAEVEALRINLITERTFREDQQRFLSMLAHELKTSISVIRMLLGKSSAKSTALQGIQTAISDINAVIDRCLQVGRLSDGRGIHPFSVFDPSALVRKIIHDRHAEAFTHVIDSDGLSMESDEHVVGVLLTNLLENAWRYRAVNSDVTVRIHSFRKNERDGVLFSVENQPGLTGYPDAEQVFSKYYRSPGAYRQSGSGLGLYLVSGFADRLSGTVEYLPQEGLVRFELWLPC